MPQLNPPLPKSASFNAAPAWVRIVFDHKLTPALPLDTANWTVILDGVPRLVTAVAALADYVQVNLGLGGGMNGVNHVTYAPPPFDVLGTQGAPAAAFANFPIT